MGFWTKGREKEESWSVNRGLWYKKRKERRREGGLLLGVLRVGKREKREVDFLIKKEKDEWREKEVGF